MNATSACLPVHQRILDITATTLCVPAIINAPRLLMLLTPGFSASFLLAVGLLVGTIVVAILLYLGRRAVILPACAIPALSLYFNLRTVVGLMASGADASVILHSYLLGSSSLLLIHAACLAALLYVFVSERKMQRAQPAP